MKLDIQIELQKIHHQFGITEKANYEIQKLFDQAVREALISYTKGLNQCINEAYEDYVRDDDIFMSK